MLNLRNICTNFNPPVVLRILYTPSILTMDLHLVRKLEYEERFAQAVQYRYSTHTHTHTKAHYQVPLPHANRLGRLVNPQVRTTKMPE